MGITDKNGNPDMYYGLMLDLALSTRFELDDLDREDFNIYRISLFIASVGAALKVKYPSSIKKPPIKRIDRIKNANKRKLQVANEMPTQEELFKQWNIKL